jgi:hypothetical protein
MKKFIVSTLAIFLCSFIVRGSDLLTLSISVGGQTNTYTDSGSGSISIPTDTTIGGWEFLSGNQVTSQPALGDASDDYLYINLGDIENVSGSLPVMITATESSFTAFSSDNGIFNMSLLDNAGANSFSEGYLNGASVNSLNETSGETSSSQPIVNSALTSPFTMKETLVLSASPAASGQTSAELYLTPLPEPSTIGLVAGGLLGLWGWCRRKA